MPRKRKAAKVYVNAEPQQPSPSPRLTTLTDVCQDYIGYLRSKSKASVLPSPQAPPTNIKPMETRFAGCRFRSRLEARWAVFFEKLGVKWQYEPEGIRLPGGKGYLPDFYLPAIKTLVEVKGDPKNLDVEKLIEAKSNSEAVFLLILGEIPFPTRGLVPVHYGITTVRSPFGDSSVQALLPMCLFAEEKPLVVFPRVVGLPLYNLPNEEVLCPHPSTYAVQSEEIAAAYVAARSARFEHGECG